MTKREARKIVLVAMGRYMIFESESTEIFMNGKYSDEEVDLLRKEMKKLGNELWDRGEK